MKDYKNRIIAVFTVTIAAVSAAVHSADQSSEEVFKQVSASVVLIEDLDTHGSGVVLSRDGLIVTNFHVVASGLPVKVTAKVKEGSQVVEKTFEDVEVSLVHSKYDLALLKVDFPNGVFAAAKKLGETEELATGGVCYAIGNPEGHDGGALTHSITEGLVSSASRVLDDLEYIQISAALNPGNSGGAVADSQSRLVGIATWKLGQSDNIGFAIPVSALDQENFIPRKERKPNWDLAERYQDEATRIAEQADYLEGPDRELGIRIAAILYRKSLENAPGDPAPYNNLGVMYLRLQDYPIARKFFERAIEIRPNYASSLNSLGVIIAKTDGDAEEARELWYRGTTQEDKPEDVAACAESLAVSYHLEGKGKEAAYFARWALALGRSTKNTTGIWRENMEELTDWQFTSLRDMTKGFSKEHLTEFLKSTSMASPAVPDPEPVIQTVGSDIDCNAIAGKLRESAVPISASGLTRPLPGKPEDTIIGYAGTCLLMKFPDLNRIGVFDLLQAKLIKYIDLQDSNAVFAAGGKVLLIYSPSSRMFEYYDMGDWSKKKEKLYRSELQITNIAMGLQNHQLAMVVRPDGSYHDGGRLGVLSVADGSVSVPSFHDTGKGIGIAHLFGHMGERTKVHMEETGAFALVTGSGRGRLTLSNLEKIDASYQHSGGSSLNAAIVLGGANEVTEGHVYLEGGQDSLMDVIDERQTERTNRLGLANVYGYRGIVDISKVGENPPSMKVRALPQLGVTFSSELDPELFDRLYQERRTSEFFASAYAKRVAIVDPDNSQVTLLALDKEADAIREGSIAPGKDFVRKLEFSDGATVRVDSGPSGLVYDKESQEIRWSIPADQERGTTVSMIFHITSESGEESFHIEKVTIP